MFALPRPKDANLTAKIWLIAALIFFILWLFLWLTNSKERAQVLAANKTNDIVQYGLPSKIDDLNELSNVVPTIDFETITRDLRNYPNEFKDKNFFLQHQKKWTVQVMDVAEHRIITDYLENQSNREQFAYFRYTDTKGDNRYILIYGLMSSFQEALGVGKTVDFRLPDNARVLPEQMQRYLDMMDNYERGVNMDDRATVVELKKTTREIPVEPVHQDEVMDKKTAKDIVEESVVRQEVIRPYSEVPDGNNLRMAPTAKIMEEPVVPPAMTNTHMATNKEFKKLTTDGKKSDHRKMMDESPVAGVAEEY